MNVRMRRPTTVLLLLVLAVPLLGCNIFAGLTDSDDRIAEKRTKAWLASQGVTQTAEPAEATQTESASKPDLAGTWAGTLRLNSFKVYLDDEGAKTFEDAIASTLNKDYPIRIVVKTDAGGSKTAALTVGDDPIPGTIKEEADEFVMVFKKEGDKKLAVGSSPTVAFTLRGSVDQPNVMRGKVLYEVLGLNGEPGWDENGSWEAVRR